MKNSIWTLCILISVLLLFVGYRVYTHEIDNNEDPAKVTNALYTHLGIKRWSRPLSAENGHRYKAAEVVYQLEDQEEVILRLTIEDYQDGGNLEVIIQDDIDQRIIVSLAVSKNGGSMSTRRVFDKKFVHNPASFSGSYQNEAWQEVTLLMAGGKTSASSFIDDPDNLEKVVLRLVE